MAIADLLHPPISDEAEEIKPMPMRLHAILQQRIIFLLTQDLGLDIALPELAVAVLDDLGRNIVPDVLALGIDAQFENGILTSGSDLAVEIMSPKQQFSRLVEKCERLLASGLVPTCWIIWPEHQTIFVYDLQRGLKQETSEITFFSTKVSRQVVLSSADVVGFLPVED